MTCKSLKTLFISTSISWVMMGTSWAEEVGVNAVVKGQVTITDDTETSKPAVVKDPVYLGNHIKSQAESSLQILLKDKTVFTVGPQADLTIDEFVYNPRSNSNKITAKVQRGMFRYMSGNAARGGSDNIQIDTPTASMGVRGTIFEAIIGPEALLCAEKEGVITPGLAIDYAGATLIVLRGPGQQSNTRHTRGEIIVTSGGESVTLDQSGLATFIANDVDGPSDTFFISDVLFNYFNRRLRSEPSGDDNMNPFVPEPRLIRPEILFEPTEGMIPFEPLEELDLPRGDFEPMDDEPIFDDNEPSEPIFDDDDTGGGVEFDPNSDA